MTKRFETLVPREVLSLAINVEHRNAERFRSFAASFRGYDDKAAGRFDELAAEEDDHEALLRRRYEERFGSDVLPIHEWDVSGVVEAVDLDDAEHHIFDSVDQKRVYELALAAERYAHAFYERALDLTDDPELQELYRELADLEAGHEDWIEERLQRLEELQIE